MRPPTPARTVPRILFCSPCGPYPKAPVDRDPIDFFYYRNTLGQGLFQLRSFQSWYSLHFLAQNLPVPSVVLENPTMRRFQEEVECGGYQVVAIGFTVVTTGRVLEMVSWLKRARPDIEIILGGYGTAVFKDPDPAASMLQSKADAICSGEGIAFMRTYLHNRWGLQIEPMHPDGRSLQQDFPPMEHCFVHTPIPYFRQLVLLGSLGCTFGCPFCATSSQFQRRRLLVTSGRELFNVLLAQARKHPDIQSAIIYDEDFLVDRHRVLEFMHLMERCTELQERPMLLTVFASLHTLGRYSTSELIRCGVGTIYIGVESFQTDVLQRESIVKRDGDIEEAFRMLHRHGINTLGSLILGWDGQTAAEMREESERFAALNPTFYQVVPLHPVPGTPLWKRLKEEHRIPEGHAFENDSIDRFTFELRGAGREEALQAVSDTYRRLVAEGGPWPFRFAETLLSGYRELSRMDGPEFRTRARAYRKLFRRILPLAMVGRLLYHGEGFARRWERAMRITVRMAPLLTLVSAVVAMLAVPILVALYAGARASFWLRPSGDQPTCMRREYAGDRSVSCTPAVPRRSVA